MGVVYRAYDPELGRQVALKVLTGDTSRRDLARFRREYSTASKLQHPGLARVHDAGSSASGELYFIQDLIVGQSLQDLLDQREPWPSAEIALQGAKIADALHYMHEKGIWHRDVKPANVILREEDGAPVLVDLGLVSDSESNLTQTGTAMGTPDYWSPEQALGIKRSIDHRTDIYSLGATLYALASGDPPFSAHCVQAYIIAHAAKTAEPIKGPLGEVITKAMSKAAKDRYQTAAEMATALRGLSSRAPWYRRIFRKPPEQPSPMPTPTPAPTPTPLPPDPISEIRIIATMQLSRREMTMLAARVHKSIGEPVPMMLVIEGPKGEMFRAKLGNEFINDERLGRSIVSHAP